MKSRWGLGISLVFAHTLNSSGVVSMALAVIITPWKPGSLPYLLQEGNGEHCYQAAYILGFPYFVANILFNSNRTTQQHLSSVTIGKSNHILSSVTSAAQGWEIHRPDLCNISSLKAEGQRSNVGLADISQSKMCDVIYPMFTRIHKHERTLEKRSQSLPIIHSALTHLGDAQR